MDKWKIIVVVLLLAGLSGYGMYQQNASQPPKPETPTDPAAQPTPPPANQKLERLKNQAPPAWNIPADLWTNTKQPISLDSLKGSVALVEFWRIGCSHCEAASPFLDSLYKKHKGAGLKMVAIHSPGAPGPENPENDWATVKQTVQSWGLSYPVAYDEGGMLFKETYGGDTYPVILLLDREGKVRLIHTGHGTRPQDVEKRRLFVAELEKMLKEK